MISKRRILSLTEFDILPGLPEGLPRREGPDYILSRTYARILGDNLPRRGILLRLAATMALCAIPFRPARAVPLVAVTIAGVVVGEATFYVWQHTFGSFKANNNSDEQKKGYVNINVLDTKSENTEGSMLARFSFPPNTETTTSFTKGPAASSKGDKSLEVIAEDSSDSDDFEAV